MKREPSPVPIIAKRASLRRQTAAPCCLTKLETCPLLYSPNFYGPSRKEKGAAWAATSSLIMISGLSVLQTRIFARSLRRTVSAKISFSACFLLRSDSLPCIKEKRILCPLLSHFWKRSAGGSIKRLPVFLQNS